MCFPKLPKLAIFDMDGLIFDSERLFMKFLQQHSAQKGYTITQEDYLRTLGIGGDYLAAVMEDICGPDYPLEEVSDLAVFLQRVCEGTRPPGKAGNPGASLLFLRAGDSLLRRFLHPLSPCEGLPGAGRPPAVFLPRHRRGAGSEHEAGSRNFPACLRPLRCPAQGRPGAGGL